MSEPASVILIVDDEIQNRKLLEALLRADGYLTVCAESGQAALDAIALQAPDLILLDVMMPDMDGYQVARILKSDSGTSNIPIIMLTALIDRNARLEGLKAGAEDFLTKPADRAELSLRVRNLLRLKTLNDFFQNHSTLLEQQVQERTVDLQRFRTAMDATADAIFLVDRDSMNFIELNSTACSMLGYTRAEILQMGPGSFGVVPIEQLKLLYDNIVAGNETNALKETQLQHKDGHLINVEVYRQAQLSGASWIIVAVVRDITERKEAEQRLHHMAHFDALTGLPNRTLFYETLNKTLIQATLSDCKVAVIFIDLDHFKDVNDTLGHAFGDALLRQFSDRLFRCLRIRDTIGRLGGDEFALILLVREEQNSATVVANKIRDVLRAPFDLGGHEVTVTASMGITFYPDDASDPETLIKYADTAMYKAKQSGRNTYRFFTAQMNTEVLAKIDLESALRKAIELEEFILYYQPKVQVDSGRVVGLEALLRWNRPDHGLVSPKDFIPVLEETGMIVLVGSWVISTACKQIKEWQNSITGPMQVSVNVSGLQFVKGDLDAEVLAALKENGVPPDLLELELTESTLMMNTDRTIGILKKLKSHGVQISIDDFGTGYSSLAYLRRFPIDKLKIDIAFIRDITSNPDDAAIALAITSMAHSLKLEVVAEGVETEAQFAFLRRHQCDQIQGYYFSPPLPAADFQHWLRNRKELAVSNTRGEHVRKTLLLVDDEEFVLSALKRLFRNDGYQVLTANSAAEGFEQLALHPVQVILCDQRMPEMSGTTFLDRVKDLYPNTFRIVLSGYTELQSIIDSINRGSIYRFYIKPWDNKVLRENISDAFRHYWILHDMENQGGKTIANDLVDP